MSNNYPEKNQERNEAADSFNLSKEELMNCFGSQIASQSSKSDCDYQNEYNIPENDKKISQDNSQKSQKGINKDDILKNICHGIIDMFFSQKEELKGIKEEIKKLQNIMINNGGNNPNVNNISNNNINNNDNKTGNKRIKNNNNINYNFNNSKKNQFISSYNSNNNNINSNYQIRNINKKHRPKSKSPVFKSKIPETVPEVDEELELKSNKKLNNNNFDPFFGENPEENAQINFKDIKDDEFDKVLRKGRNDNIKNKMMMNDPFKKSSELKKRQNSKKNLDENNIKNAYDENNLEKNNIDTYIDIDDENDNENNINNNINDNNNNYGDINLDMDEMPMEFMAGGKKITLKLDDNARKKLKKEMTSLDEPINVLEDLSNNRKPSNIHHINSKLSCSEIPTSKNKNIELNLKSNNIGSKSNQINSKMKISKRTYNQMIENSKKIVDKENISKKEEERKNGSSVKERGGLIKRIKKFGNSNDYTNLILNNNINKSNPISKNNSQNTHKKIIKNKKQTFGSISEYEFYCLCQKQNYAENESINLIENSKCNICKNTCVINIKNFQQGFYYYVLNNIENISEIDASNSIFQSLIKDSKELSEKESDLSIKKEFEQFFNYQFIFLVYDKYLKSTREKENNSEIVIENLIEDIYSKLIDKYVQVFVKAKRSFLTEVSEGDSTLGFVNICLLLMNISKTTDHLSGDTIIEFSDGFKSCFANINSNDPINKLMENMVLHNWMNVQIGMSKVLNITEDFKVFIKIYYNAISPYENNDINNINYGPLLDKNKFLPKNITELKNDGGEISSINVIIMNKSDYYVNNHTKKQRFSRKKYENELLKIRESSDKKNYRLSDSDEKNNMNNNINEIKEPDLIFFHFQAIAMDYEIYNLIKKGENINSNNTNNKNFENMLKKKYVIEFCVRYQGIYDNIEVGKMYQLMFLNLENKNSANNGKKYYGKKFKENSLLIKFNDKSQLNEIPLNVNYKTDKAYITTNELINKNISLTNNIDIGKVFIECEESQKEFNRSQYANKEVSLTGIYSGYVDKIRSCLSPQNNNNNSEVNEGNLEEEKLERYIFLSIGIEKIAIIKLHKEDFFAIDVKSNLIKDKIFNCTDIIFSEIIYFDNDNSQPKITGNNKMENSIPLLNFKTNCYTSINFGNYNKNKEQIDMFNKFKEKNKKLVDLISEVIE